jgi:hypothetical protein
LIDGIKREPVPKRAGYVLRDGAEVSLEDEVREAVLTLRTQDRAVTCRDFEELALKADPQEVMRAYCVPQRDLRKNTLDERRAEADAHVSVIIAPALTPLDSVLLFGGETDASLLQESDWLKPTNLDELSEIAVSEYLQRAHFLELASKKPQVNYSRRSQLIREPKTAINILNEIIKGPSLYDPRYFARGGGKLRPETRSLLTQSPQGQELVRLNRMLLEDAYPDRIKKREFFTDVTTAAFKYDANISLPTLHREFNNDQDNPFNRGIVTIADPRLYLGSNTTFGALRFELTGYIEGYELVFKYFDGKQNAWVQLTNRDHQLIDNTANWNTSGSVTFTPPTDWKQCNVNGMDRYWIYVSTSLPPNQLEVPKAAVANRIGRDLTEKVRQYLEPRRLLTTRVHVVGPRYLEVAVHVTLFLKHDAVRRIVKEEAEKALEKFLDPFKGGTDGKGWPFGRNIYVSEIYALLNRLPGVDYVTTAIDPKTGNPLMNEKEQPYPELTVVPEDNPLRRIPTRVPFDSVADDIPMEGTRLEADELVAFSLANSHLQIVDRKSDIARPLLESLKA